MSMRNGRTFNEAAELFGVPPESDRFQGVADLIFSPRVAMDPVGTMQECLELADQVEGDCYFDIVGPSFDLTFDGIKFERLQDYFHRVAAFGEARMLSRIVASLHHRAILEMQTAGHA